MIDRNRQRPPSVKDIEKRGYVQPPPEDVNWKDRVHQKHVDDVKNRAPYNIGIKDIDEVVFYYFDHIIKPAALKYDTFESVPVFYNSPENWKSLQVDGRYRDKNGKMQLPIISFVRTRLEKDRSLSSKVNVITPLTATWVTYNTEKNLRRPLSKVSNTRTIKEYHSVVVPNFVILSYSCMILSNYVEDANVLEEVINYYTDTYWGEPERYQFMATVDAFDSSIETLSDNDRVVKTDFNLSIRGHLLPSSVNTLNQGQLRSFSPGRVVFGAEVVSK